jgi:hypothetical protein
VNIEDSTVVVGGDRLQSNDAQAELRARREGTATANRSPTRVNAQSANVSRATARAKGVAPAWSTKVEPVRATKQVAVPNSRRAAGSTTTARPTTGTRAATPARATTAQARTATRPATGLAADVGQGHTTRKEAQRGTASRSQAQQRASAPPRAAATAPRPAQPRAATASARTAPRATAPTRQASRASAPARQGGGGLAAGYSNSGKVRQQADRGRASRGGGGRRG